MLKILLLSPWLPWPPHDGARIRILETIRYLGARHRLTVLANVTSEQDMHHAASIRDFCTDVHVEVLRTDPPRRVGRIAVGLARGYPIIQTLHYNGRLARRLASITASERFDVVQMELSLTGRYANAIDPRCGAKRVLATHNIETQRYEREMELLPLGLRRAALSLNSSLFPNWEEQVLASFDGAVAVSDLDRDWLAQRMPNGRVCLVPNGVDTGYFQPISDRGSGSSIVFTGVMDYPPNIDAVVWFVESILPRLRAKLPHLRFDIVGAKPAPRVVALRQHEGVCVTGEVADIRPYVTDALAFVVPLRSGGGTRLKILQAMAMGCPVVSTRIGAEGLAVSDGEDILFADDPAQFVTQVERLDQSRELCEALGHGGRALVTSRYDWQACLSSLEDLYRRLLGDVAP